MAGKRQFLGNQQLRRLNLLKRYKKNISPGSIEAFDAACLRCPVFYH
jgi:hypothetical protein